MVTPSTRRPSRARGGVAHVCDGTALGRKRLRQVGVAALSSQLKHIRDSVAVVSEQSGVEDIHQMRVATRRLRTMAHLLQQTPTFRAKRVARLRERLQPLAQYLGAVRDLDILLESLNAYERSVVEPTQTSSALRDELLWRREKALHHLRRALSQPAMQRLLHRPKQTAKRMLSRSRSARRVLVRHVAGDALWRRYEAVLSFEEVVDGFAATEQLHALRITCKQLRYALELFSEEDDPCAKSLIETLKAVQAHLGELQDSVFAVTLLTHLRHDYPRNHLLEGFRADQEARRNALRQDFMPLWETISGSKYRQELAGLIAAL